MEEDKAISAWIRRTERLADRLAVNPSEVYDALIERGYTGSTARTTIPTAETITVLASLFRPEELLSCAEVISRYLRLDNQPLRSINPPRYIKEVLSRHSNGRGKNRFRKTKLGVYRLNPSNHELRAACLEELSSQKGFVGSRRLMEMFDISYERLKEVLGPPSQQGRVVSRPNMITKARDWALAQYAESYSR